MRSAIFLFPGQNSADPRLLTRARAVHPAAEAIAARATGVLGAEACRFLGRATTTLDTNRDVQIAVFLATQMYLAALDAEGVSAVASAGLSLGEFSHLVHIGALTFEEALLLVSERGHCFDRSPQGVMVTVLGADRYTVQTVVREASRRGWAVISSFNAPTQHVIAGNVEAVVWAATTLEEEHGAYTTMIEHRVPMHSPLMASAARAFSAALAQAAWRRPSRVYLPNVTATPLASPAAADFVRLLTQHVCSPVLWDDSVDCLAARHCRATFVEVGPGAVLFNLMSRAWKRIGRARVDALDDGDPRAQFTATVQSLRAFVSAPA